VDLYRSYKPYLLSIFSDVRFPREGKLDNQAGFALLRMVREQSPDLPLLNLSSEEGNRQSALEIPAHFLNKNSPCLHHEIRDFFTRYLGFGEFVFRLPSGEEVARASNLREMEKIVPSIPETSLLYHARHNHFSSWLMARSEIMLATKLKPVKASDFSNTREMKAYLVNCLLERRRGRQRGIVTEMGAGNYDPVADFTKIGRGSMGGKARGIAFLSTLLKEQSDLQQRFQPVDIRVPKTMVVSTEGFDAFVNDNDLRAFALEKHSDRAIAEAFAAAPLPEWLHRDLAAFIEQTNQPLAVRSSSLLEDAQFQPFAGLYCTYMLPNNHPDPARRLERLSRAIKLVYASTYFEGPKSYAKSTFHRTEDEKMAVIVQHLTGRTSGDFFHPTFSGVAQSYNFYPIGHMKSEEGIAHVALGLGKTVVEGGTSLRFSPYHPQLLPQFSTVEDILQNSQRFFYALKLTDFPEILGENDEATLARLEIDDVARQPAVQLLTSSYLPEEHRIRDGVQAQGYPVLTFAGILKYQGFPLAGILTEILEMGRRGMGCPVEIEFAVDLDPAEGRSTFDLLQIRPMAVTHYNLEVDIEPGDIPRAICYSTMALGNGQFRDIADVVFVKPENFEPAHTVEMAAEIGKINAVLNQENRKYLLIGPGRWGSADRWLGIPVRWNDISGVGAIVETVVDNFKPDPSQGSHFFHNITSLGISYLTIAANSENFIQWEKLESFPVLEETKYLKHVRTPDRLTLKIDGRHSRAVVLV
jgi:hypothetical protein